MVFKGKVTYVSPVASGTSKAGKAWSKIEVVLVYDAGTPEFERSIVFSVMNDNIAKFGITVGGEYEVEVSFSTREYNGRYYMSASAWKCTTITAAAPQAVTATATPEPAKEVEASAGGDLPF